MYKNNFVAVIKCNGKILRERDGGNVYLPFGSEYSILLKNKSAVQALVDIEVDGKNVLKEHKLIVSGNETKEIKGFMRSMSKTNRFKFINKTKEIQRHRGDRIDDGLVRITYQFEKQVECEPYWYPSVYINTTEPICPICPPKLRGSGDFTYIDSNTATAVFSCNAVQGKSSAPLEDEGITVKGDKITQNYHYGDVGTLESSIHTIVLHLKGLTAKRCVVKKPITVKTKFKCETCGRKNRSTNKFCYNCGTYLQ